MKYLLTITACLLLGYYSTGQSMSIVTVDSSAQSFLLGQPIIYTDKNDDELVQVTAALLQQDLQAVTGKKPAIAHRIEAGAKNIIIIGSVEKSSLLKELSKAKKINISWMKDQWEAYQLQTISNPYKGVENALVISGSDRRAAAFGVFEFSRQIGVSPWYWWADVPVKKSSGILLKKNKAVSDAPKVKYRGIFINDEAPALSSWSKEKFGGFNHQFYQKVFELILRLKGNYIWPAMWGNAFYDDDSLNIRVADQYGIVIGTSHHEPLMRAHDEWRRYGSGKWNYDSNEVRLKAFWKKGIQRATNEKIVTIGMRGDGDEPMSRETATSLLERIVKDQRDIISSVTGKPASSTPQLWALYKEVQDYYDKGMRVPDDVTLLLCDDNWGNIRKLPRLHEKPRKGGYGIYYHFDYVGGPRNYKWLNTNPIPRVWEQMHLAWEYNAREIWIVNVGDIKPMEFPISFFLDYAWNPTSIGPDDLLTYTTQWASDQFGPAHAGEIAKIIAAYTKYNGRRKPELLDDKTYSLDHYQEFQRVVSDYQKLALQTNEVMAMLSPQMHDAFFQLVQFPVLACANLYELYYYQALNKKAYENGSLSANYYAEKVKECYVNDSLLTLRYHQLNNGKWNYMMSQAHIGYTYWQQPPAQKMPAVRYLIKDSAKKMTSEVAEQVSFSATKPVYISIDAADFTTAINSGEITWTILPDHGRTGDAVTAFPVTATAQQPGNNTPHLEYEFSTAAEGTFKINAYFSPTLNFHNTPEGLQYAIAVDDEKPQIVSINKEDKITGAGIWNKWVAENIIIKTTDHQLSKPGKHILRYWMVNPGVVLQKLVLDFGGAVQSYLGPPESKIEKNL